MKFLLSCLLATFFTVTSLYAFESKELGFVFPDFQTASKAESFLRFDMESTAIGFLTTRFSGFAKKFTLSWEQEAGRVRNLKIVIPVAFMDTDRDGRNEEMREDCLEFKQYPDLVVELPYLYEIKEDSGSHKAEAIGQIRGKKVRFTVDIEATKRNDVWSITGKAPVKLENINIKNPSKALGLLSFNDQVDIFFQFIISSK